MNHCQLTMLLIKIFMSVACFLLYKLKHVHRYGFCILWYFSLSHHKHIILFLTKIQPFHIFSLLFHMYNYLLPLIKQSFIKSLNIFYGKISTV